MGRAVVASLWAGAILAVLTGSLPDSAVRRSLQFQRNLVALAPQGWAFFTRDPREAVDRIYLAADGGWVAAGAANASRRNWFGLKRDGRVLNVELASMLGDVPADRWSGCRDAVEACAGDRGVAIVEVDNRSLTRFLCGEILVDRRPPVPWAWSRSKRPVYMASRIIRLRARCDAPGGEL